MSKVNAHEVVFEGNLDAYETILADFNNRLKIAKTTIELSTDIKNQFDQKFKKDVEEIRKKLTPDEKKQVLDANKLILDQIANLKDFPASISGKFILGSENAVTGLSTVMDSIKLPMQITTYIFETSLVYLITTFEVFLKNNLKLVLGNEPRMLKTNKEMSHKDILESNSIQELKNKILEKEVNLLMDKDIDKLGKKLAENFKLHLIQKDNWKDFIEIFYRRHVIVHNNSVPDDMYRYATKSTIQNFTTDQDYVLKSIELFYEYAEIISNSFQKHYSKSDDENS